MMKKCLTSNLMLELFCCILCVCDASMFRNMFQTWDLGNQPSDWGLGGVTMEQLALQIVQVCCLFSLFVRLLRQSNCRQVCGFYGSAVDMNMSLLIAWVYVCLFQSTRCTVLRSNSFVLGGTDVVVLNMLLLVLLLEQIVQTLVIVDNQIVRNRQLIVLSSLTISCLPAVGRPGKVIRSPGPCLITFEEQV